MDAHPWGEQRRGERCSYQAVTNIARALATLPPEAGQHHRWLLPVLLHKGVAATRAPASSANLNRRVRVKVVIRRASANTRTHFESACPSNVQQQLPSPLHHHRNHMPADPNPLTVGVVVVAGSCCSRRESISWFQTMAKCQADLCSFETAPGSLYCSLHSVGLAEEKYDVSLSDASINMPAVRTDPWAAFFRGDQRDGEGQGYG